MPVEEAGAEVRLKPCLRVIAVRPGGAVSKLKASCSRLILAGLRIQLMLTPRAETT